MRDEHPEYIVLRRRQRTGLIVPAVVGVLCFVTGLACGLGLILAVVLAFVAAGVVAASRRHRPPRWRDYDEEGW